MPYAPKDLIFGNIIGSQSMKKLFINPLFLLGIAIRIGFIVSVDPEPIKVWFGPFLDSSIDMLVDPWGRWIELGGAPAAFPYGYVMWFVFLPFTTVAKLLGIRTALSYSGTLITADVAMLLMFRKMLPGRDHFLLLNYWLSPIVIISSYLLGFNDLIPVLMLVVALSYARKTRFLGAGVMCVAAISAKLSMVMALPFFLIYLLHNRTIRQFLPKFIQGLTIGTGIMLLPFILCSESGVRMVMTNPEMGKIYQLGIGFGEDITVYLVPLIYLIMVYMTWKVRRLNFDLFHAMLGIAFLLVVLLTPASPGWFMWVVPLLVTYQANSRQSATVLVTGFSGLYLLSILPLNTWIASFLMQLPTSSFSALSGQLTNRLESFVHTGLTAAGVILAISIWRETVNRNDFFRLSRKPFVLGIAGDSGAGKDTFADAIKGLFGNATVTTLSGDDYHLWDRHKPMWQAMTHLNPLANDLDGYANDLISLTDGRPIHCRHYNHETGRMSRLIPIKSNDVIIATGLHALYLPILRECYNLSIFLDINEDLRKHFKLERDVHKRGHTVEKVLSSLARRQPDSDRFIRPQANYADLILSLQPIRPGMLDRGITSDPLRFKLLVRSRHGMIEQTLTRVLVGICGLHVDVQGRNSESEVELIIEGESSSHDVALAAQMICPRIFEFLDVQPKWQDGMIGLMQLVTLSHINQALTRRFIW
jgi:uridine kinase